MILTRRKFFFGCAGIIGAGVLMPIKPPRALVFRGTEWSPLPPGLYTGTFQLNSTKAFPIQASASDFRMGDIVSLHFDSVGQIFQIVNIGKAK